MRMSTIAGAASRRQTIRGRRRARTARRTSDPKRGETSARGSCLRIPPSSSSIIIIIIASDPPRFELGTHHPPGPEDARLHRSDAAAERARDGLVCPLFDFVQYQRRAELDRQLLQ